MHKAPTYVGLKEVIGRQRYPHFFFGCGGGGERLRVNRTHDMSLWVKSDCHHTKARPLGCLYIIFSFLCSSLYIN